VVQGREAGEVEVDLVWLEAERSRWAMVSWAVASRAVITDSLSVSWRHPGYIPSTIAPRVFL
jgi:hypothetical protein